MKLKEIVHKQMLDKKTLMIERHKASKLALVLSSLGFFLNYFFVSAEFGNQTYLLFALPYMYVVFVISFLFYTYFSVKRKLYEKANNGIFIALLLLLLIIGGALSLPFLVSSDFISLF